MHRTDVSQGQIIEALRAKLANVVARPAMYVGDDVAQLRGLLVAYVDALAVACSGYKGGFLYGGVAQLDPARSDAENRALLLADAERVLADVPPAATR